MYPLHNLHAKNDLFSKVIVTSKRATCKKDPSIPGTFVFHYLENVIVTFADQTTIHADTVEIVFDGIKQQKKNLSSSETIPPSKDFTQHFKKIQFSNNVYIKNGGRSITADKGIVDVPSKTCLLEGNVIITQSRTKKSDIPVTVQSNRARLNLTTMETVLEGSDAQPVHTCFIFENSGPHSKKSNAKKPEDYTHHEQDTRTHAK